jgi:hypothetical protein
LNAGEINIKVTASMDDFNRTMSSVKSSADAAGAGAGGSFSNKFGNIVKDNFSEQKFGKVIGNLIGLGMADNMLRTLAETIRGDKSLGEAVNDLVSNLPIIGGAFEAGKAIGERIADGIFGATSESDQKRMRAEELAYEADMKAALKAEEEKKNAELKRIAEVRKAQEKARSDAFEAELGFQNFNSEQEKKLAQDRADFMAKAAIQAAKNAGDEEEALRLEMEKAVADEREKLLEGFADGSVAASEEEREAFKRLLAERETLVRDEFDLRLGMLRKEQAERKKGDDERLERLRENLAQEFTELENQRVSSQQAGIGSAQTALGSFKFDAYPAADKRKNDERLVGLMTNIRDQQRSAGFI